MDLTAYGTRWSWNQLRLRLRQSLPTGCHQAERRTVQGNRRGPEDVELADLVRAEHRESWRCLQSDVPGLAYYSDTRDLLAKLVELDMILQIQVEDDQALTLLPLVEHSSVRLLIDDCGRPVPGKGLEPGFTAVLGLAQTGRASVKLSRPRQVLPATLSPWGYLAYVNALVQALSLDACVWGSDLPFFGRPSESIMACC